jgi:hypothetical protein
MMIPIGALLVLVLLFPSCKTLKDVPTPHAVMFDGDGIAVDPTGNMGRGKPSHLHSYERLKNYDTYLNQMFEHIDHERTSTRQKVMIS